jgi:hypothetical protein
MGNAPLVIFACQWTCNTLWVNNTGYSVVKGDIFLFSAMLLSYLNARLAGALHLNLPGSDVVRY